MITYILTLNVRYFIFSRTNIAYERFELAHILIENHSEFWLLWVLLLKVDCVQQIKIYDSFEYNCIAISKYKVTMGRINQTF